MHARFSQLLPQTHAENSNISWIGTQLEIKRARTLSLSLALSLVLSSCDIVLCVHVLVIMKVNLFNPFLFSRLISIRCNKLCIDSFLFPLMWFHGWHVSCVCSRELDVYLLCNANESVWYGGWLRCMLVERIFVQINEWISNALSELHIELLCFRCANDVFFTVVFSL